MFDYYLGVDGGGCKTHCALFSKEGRLVDFLKWGTTSHEFLPGGYEALKAELKKMFQELRQKNNLDWDSVYVVYGLAGIDSNKQCALVSEYIRECGIKNFFLCNDSFLGIKAGCEKGWGICSMNGSGTGAGGIDTGGKTYMVGRLFELSGDYAGGRILGSEVISCVYDNLFRNGRCTVLCEYVMDRAGAGHKEDLMEKIVNGVAEHTIEVKEFAPFLFQAARRKDEVALGILDKCGRQNARDIIAVAKHLDFPRNEEIPVVLIGSLYTKNEQNAIIDSLKEALKTDESGYNFKLNKLSVAPVAGAVYWAMEANGQQFDREGISRQIADSL
jgi:N-acetylglucosamine kinase-like BadF-type ATPase